MRTRNGDRRSKTLRRRRGALACLAAFLGAPLASVSLPAAEPPGVWFLNAHGTGSGYVYLTVGGTADIPPRRPEDALLGWSWDEGTTPIEVYPGRVAVRYVPSELIEESPRQWWGEARRIGLVPLGVGPGGELLFLGANARETSTAMRWAELLDTVEAAYRHSMPYLSPAERRGEIEIGRLSGCPIRSRPVDGRVRGWASLVRPGVARPGGAFHTDGTTAERVGTVEVRRFLRYVDTRASPRCTGLRRELRLFPAPATERLRPSFFLVFRNVDVATPGFLELKARPLLPSVRTFSPPPRQRRDERLNIVEWPAGKDLCQAPFMDQLCASDRKARARLTTSVGSPFRSVRDGCRRFLRGLGVAGDPCADKNAWGARTGIYRSGYRGELPLLEGRLVSRVRNDGEVEWKWRGEARPAETVELALLDGTRAVLDLPRAAIARTEDAASTPTSSRPPPPASTSRPAPPPPVIRVVPPPPSSSRPSSPPPSPAEPAPDATSLEPVVAGTESHRAESPETDANRAGSPSRASREGAPRPADAPIHSAPGPDPDPPAPSFAPPEVKTREERTTTVSEDTVPDNTVSEDTVPDNTVPEESSPRDPASTSESSEDRNESRETMGADEPGELGWLDPRLMGGLAAALLLGGLVWRLRRRTAHPRARTSFVRRVDSGTAEILLRPDEHLEDLPLAPEESASSEENPPEVSPLEVSPLEVPTEAPAPDDAPMSSEAPLPAEALAPPPKLPPIPPPTAIPEPGEAEAPRPALPERPPPVPRPETPLGRFKWDLDALELQERLPILRALDATRRLSDWAKSLLPVLRDIEEGSGPARFESLPLPARREWIDAYDTLRQFIDTFPPHLLRDDDWSEDPAVGRYLSESGLLDENRPLPERLRSHLLSPEGLVPGVVLALQYLLEAFPVEHLDLGERKAYRAAIRDQLEQGGVSPQLHDLVAELAESLGLAYREVRYYRIEVGQPGYEFLEDGCEAISLSDRVGYEAGTEDRAVIRLGEIFLFDSATGDCYSGRAAIDAG